jgi:glycosyltransferase involved in cell wall biosynthesis
MASRSLNKKLSIRIAGWCDAAEQRDIERLCQEARLSGSDIEIKFGKLTKNEFGGYLQAADFYLAPFRKITNSGSLNAALTAGLPVVIPNLPSLKWVPRDAAIFYQPDEGARELTAAIESLNVISQDDLISMQTAADDFTSQNPWASVAEKHISLYKKVLDSD